MGTLYIVATPIGNLKDITFRAVEILKLVDLIVCEDTRVTGLLLKNFDISNKMTPVNDFNEGQKVPQVISLLKEGKNIALVSDAGTPLVSDPGFKIVRESIKYDIPVISIPGPSAVISALSVSGKPTDKFIFYGYLSKKDGKRKTQIREIKQIKGVSPISVILYESPYRVVKTLGDLYEAFGDIDAALCREMTKVHEEVKRGKISVLITGFEAAHPRGEFVIVF